MDIEVDLQIEGVNGDYISLYIKNFRDIQEEDCNHEDTCEFIIQVELQIACIHGVCTVLHIRDPLKYLIFNQSEIEEESSKKKVIIIPVDAQVEIECIERLCQAIYLMDQLHLFKFPIMSNSAWCDDRDNCVFTVVVEVKIACVYGICSLLDMLDPANLGKLMSNLMNAKDKIGLNN